MKKAKKKSNSITLLRMGVIPDTIGCTKVADRPDCIVVFRISTLDESGREVYEDFPTYKEAKKQFNLHRKGGETDIHLQAELVTNDEDCEGVDSEMIDSYFEEEH